jgi:hypothetical protein
VGFRINEIVLLEYATRISRKLLNCDGQIFIMSVHIEEEGSFVLKKKRLGRKYEDQTSELNVSYKVC